VAAGTPEQLVRRTGSYTAEFLRPKLRPSPAPEPELAATG
jgi:hypothetical protein